MLIRKIKGLLGWILHRLVVNYWSLAVSAVLLAFPFVFLLLRADANGATAWLVARELEPVVAAATAKDFLAVAGGVNAAFITLFFSITLIVLSLAGSSLGVRLIDRWLESLFIRVSIAGLCFTLVVTLVAMLRVNDTASVDQIPQLTVAVVMLLQALNLAMLAVSLHHLGRTMFVDRSIHALAQDASERALALNGVPMDQAGREPPEHVVTAPREGYVENIDLAELRDMIGGTSDGRIRVLAAPGQHVLEGQPIYRCNPKFDERRLHHAMPIGHCRSNSQGAVFQIRVLVEIGARALSPAVNDFYTALSCADKLTRVMQHQAATWVDEENLPVLAEEPRIELPGQDFRGLFEDPMNAFRQAACQYPSVAIRMIDNYSRLAALLPDTIENEEMRAFLYRLASQLHDHARSVSEYAADQEDLDSALERFGSAGQIAVENLSDRESPGNER